MMTNQTQPSLLPCAHCGGEAHLTKGAATGQVWPHGEFHRVFCGSCQVRQLFHRTPEEAIAAWNRRSQLERQLAAPAELPPLPEPKGYMREYDGRLQFSAGPKIPEDHQRGGCHFTPWAATYDSFSMLEYGKQCAAQLENALGKIRAAISTDSCDGDSMYAAGVNAAVVRHAEGIDTILREAGISIDTLLHGEKQNG